MDKEEIYIEQQTNGMDKHDTYLNLDSYATPSAVDEEMKKLQQDIDIRRRARQRLGVDGDDEAILIIDEKIKLLEGKKKELLADRRESRGFVWVAFFILTIPMYIVQPITLIIPITVITIIVLIRKRLRKNKS